MEKDLHKFEVEHLQKLIELYSRSLYSLTEQNAMFGQSSPPHVIMGIEDVEIKLKQAKTRLQEIAKVDIEKPTDYVLSPLPLPLQKYDDFFKLFAEKFRDENYVKGDFTGIILGCLKFATKADHVLLVDTTTRNWKYTGEKGLASGKTFSLDGPLQGLLLEASNQSRAHIGVLPNNSKVCLIFPFPNSHRTRMLVFIGAAFISEPDAIFEQAIYTILECTDGLQIRRAPEYIETAIYNNLKKTFGYLSEYIYERQLELFIQRLDKMLIHYEPIIYLSRTEPEIWGWEALARDDETKKAPTDLFETAELWGTRFQTQLDMYFFRKAISSYSAPFNSSELKGQKETKLPLSINVYPDSLLRANYMRMVKEETEKYIPFHKLCLEISEKMPIPASKSSENNKEALEDFVRVLHEYNSLPINFAIDDFGVGYASSSRLTRIAPAFLKIDRDALLDKFGDQTIKNVINMCHNMGRPIQIIMEGFDYDSKLSLRQLYDLGIRYVQGHKLGKDVVKTNISLTTDKIVEIQHALQGEL